MAHTKVSEPTKKRILQTCVRLFLTQGYQKTTMLQIIREAKVSSSSFQNIFVTKDGVLSELVDFMFSNQFSVARKVSGELPPVYVYAAETAIQLTLTELNENLREIYLVVYTKPTLLEAVVRETAKELQQIFSPYCPQLGYQDFYRLDIGTSGIMRSYMARRCDADFTLEQKLRCFLSLSLRAYQVPEKEVEGAIAFVEGLNIRALAQNIMELLLQSLQMHFSFTLPETEAGKSEEL